MASVIRSLLGLVLQVAGFAVIMSWLWTRQYKSYTGSLALVLGIVGGIILYDGFSLGVLEESRSRYGKVVPGLIEGRWSSSADAPYGTNERRHDSSVRTSGADEYQSFARFLLTGSLDDWAVEYSYSCNVGIGICHGRDFVTRDLWNRLHVGDAVNLRQSKDETTTSRLDENPQRGLALVKIAIACVLFVMVGFLQGRFTLFPKRKYIQADAVVTAVERVRYGNESRWKVRFAYFDFQGNAQDSVDEVNDPSWRVGDDCYAIYRPQSPDVASLQRGPTRDRPGTGPGQTEVRPGTDQGLSLV